MANVTQLKHLEHIEDEMLNYGVRGCDAAVSAMQELLRMLGKDGTSFMQTKWDGAPSVVCGMDPLAKIFLLVLSLCLLRLNLNYVSVMLTWTDGTTVILL